MRSARLLIFALVVGAAATAQAGVSLGPPVNYPVGQSGNVVRNAAVADLNGDGWLDMVVPNSTDRDVSVLFGQGNGTFLPGGAYSVDTGTGTNASPRFVVLGDFNEDGKLDLAVTDGSANNLVIVLLGNGDGSFGAPVGYALGAGTGAAGMATADLNRDGHLDLVIADSGSADVAVLRGNGNGTFQAATNYSAGGGTTPNDVQVGDFNRDGALDLAVASRTNPANVAILLNLGAGTFGAATLYPTGINSRTTAIGDFNHDGKLDLAVANNGSFDVSVLLGNGNGTFQTAVSYAAGTAPRGIAAADLDGDGVLDLAVTDANDNFVYLLTGNSNGTFDVAVPYLVGRRPDGVSLADFNGDGRPDVVTANTNSDSDTFGIWNVTVLLDTTAFAAAGNLAAKSDYAVGLNPSSLAAGDFNRDGALDLVTSDASSGTVSYLQGVGDGTFAAAVSSAAGANPYWVAAGDFNRDGQLDLAVANLAQAGTVSILQGNGTGTFALVSTANVGTYPVFVTTGDFNHDGKLDLAAANSGSDDVSVLIGNGNGTFQAAVNYGVGTTPYSIAVDDFNRDGKLDLAVANYYSYSVSILLGNGDGTFQLPADFTAGYNPVSIASGDVDGDGIADLVVADYWGASASVLLGLGEGNFKDAVAYALSTNPNGIVLRDLNRDGKLDVAVAALATNLAAIAPGKGDGTLSTAATFATGVGPTAAVSGDFDGDGRIDLATADWSAGAVSVLLNGKDIVSTPTAPTGVNLKGAGKDKGVPGLSYGFSTGGAVDSLGHPVEYQFDWSGTGTDLSVWGPAPRSNGWDLAGVFGVRARARCTVNHGVVSAWSGSLAVDIGGPTITNLQINGGAAATSTGTVTITYTTSGSATQIRTSIGSTWSSWLTLPIPSQTVSLGTLAGRKYVFAQVQDADGRISSTAWATIVLDNKVPTGVVKINGGATTVLSGGATTLVRVHMAMFDTTMTGAQVRVKPATTFTADPDPLAPWGPFDNANSGRDVLLTGTGVQKIYVQFKDGLGLKSTIYTGSITISATGAAWPGVSAVAVGNLKINNGAAYVTSAATTLTYSVSQSTNIQVRYLTTTAWSAWETPSVAGGIVTRSITLPASPGVHQVYVQLQEIAGSANPGAMSDPQFVSVTLDTDKPNVTLQVNNGVTPVNRFNNNSNYVIVTVLATDNTSGVDKIALFQTGTLPSTSVPPAASSPDWITFDPTVSSFGLNTATTGTKAIYVWVKDKAGNVASLKSISVSVAAP